MKALDKRIAALEAVTDDSSIVGRGPAKIVWRLPGETTAEAYARGGTAEEASDLVFYWPELAGAAPLERTGGATSQTTEAPND